MGIVKAEGILRHCFFGSYSCVIALEFSNEQECDCGAEPLNVGKPLKLTGDWKKSVKNPNILLGSLDEEQLEAFKDAFKPKCFPCEWRHCKGKVHSIDGLDHSVDIGSPFEVVLEFVNKNQLGLF